MARLSSPIDNIKTHYTVVVIGSGYGGGIAASRMARAGQQVCVLERGKEFQPGEYPDTQLAAASEMQTDLPAGHIGSRTGLYDMRVNDDINVFLGCGLGGTSLVNANVSLRAEPRVFDDPRWPQDVRDDYPRLEEGYRHAEEMLKPTPYPENFPSLRKLEALEKSAAHMHENFYRPPINVTFEDGVNHVGVYQQACKLCGDCCSGCNYGSKNTTIMNYLPDARNHGAEIYTQVSVRYLERQGDRWIVHYQLMGAGREKFAAPTMFVSAGIVILAAGALGSTEILLRSRDMGSLSLSEKLGHSFTGNGDVLAFAYNNDVPVNGIGVGKLVEESPEPVGPCITGIIDIRNQEQLEEGMVIEEGVIPSPVSRLLPAAFAAASAVIGEDTDNGFRDAANERGREVGSLVHGAYRGAANNTQTFLVMTHDDASGCMYLEDDRLRIDWPGVGSQPIFGKVAERLEEATRALGGTFVKSPIWTERLKHDLVTVHPLGGCPMAENVERGVVNHKSQVFSGEHGAPRNKVHEGLYVCDGAIIPRSLGVNPLLTISALAERSCALLAEERGWQIDYTLPSAPMEGGLEERRLGIQFTESMKGFFSTAVTDGYEEAWKKGKQDRSPFEFILTIVSDDLEQMLADPDHMASIVGTVVAPALSPQPLTVTGGEFNLFVLDPEQESTRKMRYRMKMTSEDGRAYYFDGFKVVRDDPGLDMWSDTTTLYITIFDGESVDGPVVGMGILKIKPTDFMRQMTTMKVRNARNIGDQIEANARFGRFFAGAVFDTYAGLARGSRKAK